MNKEIFSKTKKYQKKYQIFRKVIILLSSLQIRIDKNSSNIMGKVRKEKWGSQETFDVSAHVGNKDCLVYLVFAKNIKI